MLETVGREGNRRQYDRVEVNGCAVVHAPEGAVRGRIVNLSEGGVLLAEEAPRTQLAEGTQVTLEIETGRRGWIRQGGGVIRSAEGILAIAFTDPSPSVVEAIASEIEAAQEARRVPRVVVVDPSGPRRKKVAAALRDAGCESLEASTPLEAVDLLERSRGVRAVAVAESTQSQTLADELVAFLAEAHPSLRLALIVDRPASPSHAQPRHPRCGLSIRADASAEDSTDLRDLVREFLAGLP